MSPIGALTKTLTDLQHSESPDREWLRLKRPYKLGSMLLSDDGCRANSQNVMFKKKTKWCKMWNVYHINSTSLSQTSDMNNSSPPPSSCYYPSFSSSSSLHGIGQVFPNPVSRRKFRTRYTSGLLWVLHTCCDSRFWVVKENVWWAVL
jgi:hypothetical protein